MKNGLLYILAIAIWAAPCYADVEVSASKTQNLDFGKALPLNASSATVGIGANGKPIWLRAMNYSGEPRVGQITFTATGLGSSENRVVTPVVPADFNLPTGTDCTLYVTNFSFLPANVTLTAANPSATVNVGGSVRITGWCQDDYTYSGVIPLSYNVSDTSNGSYPSGVVNLQTEVGTHYDSKVRTNSDMNFGKIMRLGESGGYVTLTPQGAISSISEGLRHYGGESAGQISVYGMSGLHVVVEYPKASDSVQICDGSSHCMTIDQFTLSPNDGNFYLTIPQDETRYTADLFIGGRLHVNDNQPAGEYRTTIDVRLSYE